MKINLVDCLPSPPDGSPKRLLPKQQQFFDCVVNPSGPKYVLYAGGVGSAKTTIGCLTTLSLAVLYPGDYLVCRLFNPELKITTMKTFRDICPKELIVEDRVADQIIRIRSSNGKVSNVIFRGIDEPDKLRSLNLNAAYIDESSQVSQEAFLLLQSRLRGAHVRKIYMTTNPAGHDWQYQLFVKQDGLSLEARKAFRLIKAPSTENVFLPEGYVQSMLDSYSKDRIEREIYASFDSFSGQIYHEFRRDVHVIKPFKIPDEWPRFCGLDHGFRNPTAVLWGAMDYDGTVYIYREFYEREWIIEEICKGNKKQGKKGIIALNGKDKIQGIWIDPSTRANRGKDSDFQTYLDHLPKEWALIPANNEVEAGIDRVKQYLKINDRTGKPSVYIFDTCSNLIEEMTQYRYEELQPGQEMNKNLKETPVKKNDHACFVGDTKISTVVGFKYIKDIRVGDTILTSLGPKKVLASRCVGVKPVWEYVFTNGARLISTPDHPVLTLEGKRVNIHDLTLNDTAVNVSSWFKLSSLTGFYLGKLVDTTAQMEHIAKKALNLCIERFGKPLTGLFHQDTIFTTKTVIPTTMTYQTWNAFWDSNTYQNMLKEQILGQNPKKESSIWQASVPLHLNGIDPKKGVNGIGNTLSKWLRKGQKYLKLLSSAWFAIKNTALNQSFHDGLNSSTLTVKQKRFIGEEKVYNLAIAGVSEYYAEGILVSNCDSFRYMIMSRPEAPKPEDKLKKQLEQDNLTGAIMREMQELRKPKSKDPFGDY
jgi:phage terminase large subunit